jgi:hypothetical protein
MSKVSTQFRFEPGSYGDNGAFVPSIACLKRTKPNEWDHHFVIAKPLKIYKEEDKAVAEAEKDLQKAFQSKQQSGSDFAVAEYLKKQGYKNITGFNIVK